MGQTTCRVVVEGRTVEEILSFDYSSDVMAIAEEAHFSVENKNRKYRDPNGGGFGVLSSVSGGAGSES